MKLLSAKNMRIRLARPTTLPSGKGTFQRKETQPCRETLSWSQMHFLPPTTAAIVIKRRTTSGDSRYIPTHFVHLFIGQASISLSELKGLSFHATVTAVTIRLQCWP